MEPHSPLPSSPDPDRSAPPSCPGAARVRHLCQLAGRKGLWGCHQQVDCPSHRNHRQIFLRAEPDPGFLSTQMPWRSPPGLTHFQPHGGGGGAEKGRSWALCYRKLTPLAAHAGDTEGRQCRKFSVAFLLLSLSSGCWRRQQVLFDWTKGSPCLRSSLPSPLPD